ncbi:hypothetical protein [Aminobacter sp. Piv2-1]|uniref:hypothetical protein n=1 Tax=Aminobacter sp. Piv2-1 TaxID=3031122 RepID=UPI00403EFF98
MKVDGRWRIASKVFHFDLQSNRGHGEEETACRMSTSRSPARASRASRNRP